MNQRSNNIPDAEKTKEKRRTGERLLIVFNKLLHMAKIHGATNDLCIAVCRQFKKEAVALVNEEGQLTIEAKHSRIYIQGEKLLHRPETSAVTLSMLELFEEFGVYGFAINGDLTSTNAPELYEFARMVNASLTGADPKETLRGEMESGRFPWIQTIFETQLEKEKDEETKKNEALRVYSYAYNSVMEVGKQITEKRNFGTRKAMRSLQNLVDIIDDDVGIVLGLSTIRDYDDYTYTHSVNVSILSMSLGSAIGLSRSSLMLLGMCALFHDLGKIDLDVNILNKPGKLTDDEFKHIQQHSLNSVRQIIHLDAFRDLIAKLILPPFEHHLKYDLSGYPNVNWNRPISLFGRIIAICDVYDALTAPRVYRPVAISPDRALGIMMENSGKDFDPTLLKWFVNMIGVYPVGTLLKLDTGEIALVKKGDSQSDVRRPCVLLLQPNNPDGFAEGETVELSNKDQRTNKYLRNVISSHHPSELGIQPAQYLTE